MHHQSSTEEDTPNSNDSTDTGSGRLPKTLPGLSLRHQDSSSTQTLVSLLQRSFNKMQYRTEEAKEVRYATEAGFNYTWLKKEEELEECEPWRQKR